MPRWQVVQPESESESARRVGPGTGGLRRRCTAVCCGALATGEATALFRLGHRVFALADYWGQQQPAELKVQVGQVINVDIVPSAGEDVRNFDMDRSLTGMGLERYWSPADATGDDPPSELARQLFAIDGVATVFVYSNVVTVTRADGFSWDEIEPAAIDVIRNLFINYDINRV